MNFSAEERNALNGCMRLVLVAIDNEKVILTDHAGLRMAERGVSFDEIAEAIRDGHPYKCHELGRVNYSIRDLTVVVELEERGYMRIITVWKPEHEPPKYVSGIQRKRACYNQHSTAYRKAEEKANPIELY